MADIENRAYMKLTYMDRILLALMTEDKDKLFIPPMAIGCYFNISTRYVMQRYQSVIKYLERKSVTAGEYREFVSGLARISGLYVPNDLVKAITSLKKKHISIDSQITKSTMDQYSVVIRWITSKIPIVDVSDYQYSSLSHSRTEAFYHCAICGHRFKADSFSRLCPSCSENASYNEKQRAYHQAAQEGQVRKVSKKDRCAICKDVYTVRSGCQNICRKCVTEFNRTRSLRTTNDGQLYKYCRKCKRLFQRSTQSRFYCSSACQPRRSQQV